MLHTVRMLQHTSRPVGRVTLDGAQSAASHTQLAHNAIITSLLRQNDVATSFWRNNDAVIAPRACWDNSIRGCYPKCIVASPRSRQNGHHFAHDIFKFASFYMYENHILFFPSALFLFDMYENHILIFPQAHFWRWSSQRQTIIWANDSIVFWRIFGLDELNLEALHDYKLNIGTEALWDPSHLGFWRHNSKIL